MGFKLSTMNGAVKPEKKSFEPLQPGVYIAAITKAEGKQASTGTEYVALTFDVKDFDGNNKGKLWYNLYLTEKNAFNVKNFFSAVGCPIEDADDDAEMSPEQVAKVLEGGQVCINTTIEENEYNGKKQQRVTLDTWGVMSGIDTIENAFKWKSIIMDGVDPDAASADDFMNIPDNVEAEEVEY